MPDEAIVAITVRLVVRPLRTFDLERLRAFHSRESEQTVRARFLHQLKELPVSMAHYFTNVDHHDREALGAFTTSNCIIGVVRYDRLSKNQAWAEFAAVVEDSWQNQGIGVVLLQKLIPLAQQRGITHFVIRRQSNNHTITALLEKCGCNLIDSKIDVSETRERWQLPA